MLLRRGCASCRRPPMVTRPSDRRPQARHRGQQRRLPRSVGAEQRDDLAGADVEVDAEQHLHAVVVDVEVAHPEQCVGRRRTTAAVTSFGVGPSSTDRRPRRAGDAGQVDAAAGLRPAGARRRARRRTPRRGPPRNTSSTTSMPAPVATICHSTGSHQVTPRTNNAPSRAPGTEPSPPITTIVNTTRLSPAVYEPSCSPFCWCTNSAPRERGEEPRDRERARAWCGSGSPRTTLAACSFSRIAIEHAAGPAPPDADDRDDDERERDEAEEVEARSRNCTSTNAEQVGSLDA